MQKLGLEYRGQRLAGAAAEALLKAKRLDPRGSRDRILEEQNYQCKLCSAPIELGSCEFDHVVPVHQALEGQPQVLQALCLECHRTKTLLESSRAACLESRVCRSVHEAYVQSPRPPALVCKLAKCDPDRICHGVDVVRCRKNALANATFPLPVFSPLDSVEVSRDGHLADLTHVELHRDDRQALLRKLPYLGRGWYSKPAAAYLLETGQATWADFKWCLDATAHVEPRCLAQALEVMEDAWPEGEEHMAKLSVNALIGLWARNQDLVYSMRTSNHELDGQGCQWRQTFTDAAGKVHWDHIYATELFSNYTLRPLHDYVMAQEHVAVAKIPRPPAQGPAALRRRPEDGLPGLPGPAQEVPARGAGAHGLEAPGRHAGVPLRGVQAPGGRVPGAPHRGALPDLLRPGVAERGGPPPALPEREEPPPLGHARHREDAPGAPDRGAALRARGGGQARLQDPLLRAEPGRRSADGGPLRPPEHPQRELRAGPARHRGDHAAGLQPLGRHRGAVPEPQGQVPAPGRLPAAAGGAGRLRGRAGDEAPQGLPAPPRPDHRSDEAIFGFLRYLRVDEAEEPPLREALQLARERFPRRGQPDTCLVISHANRMRLNEQHNRRLAPAEAVTLRYEGRAAAGTNAPQTMRVWPGLRLVGAGGKVSKGCFVAVTEAGPDAVRLETGERFTHAELLRHTRLCHAITYASCQGLTLRGRVHLCDTSSPHFELRHLYVGASRATSAELLSVL